MSPSPPQVDPQDFGSQRFSPPHCLMCSSRRCRLLKSPLGGFPSPAHGRWDRQSSAVHQAAFGRTLRYMVLEAGHKSPGGESCLQEGPTSPNLEARSTTQQYYFPPLLGSAVFLISILYLGMFLALSVFVSLGDVCTSPRCGLHSKAP